MRRTTVFALVLCAVGCGTPSSPSSSTQTTPVAATTTTTRTVTSLESPLPFIRTVYLGLDTPGQDGVALSVTATYSDGTRTQNPPGLTWTSSDPSVATVGPAGGVTGQKPGHVAVTASLGALSAAFEVKVLGSFLINVYGRAPELAEDVPLDNVVVTTEGGSEDDRVDYTQGSGQARVYADAPTAVVRLTTRGFDDVRAMLQFQPNRSTAITMTRSAGLRADRFAAPRQPPVRDVSFRVGIGQSGSMIIHENWLCDGCTDGPYGLFCGRITDRDGRTVFQRHGFYGVSPYSSEPVPVVAGQEYWIRLYTCQSFSFDSLLDNPNVQLGGYDYLVIHP